MSNARPSVSVQQHLSLRSALLGAVLFGAAWLPAGCGGSGGGGSGGAGGNAQAEQRVALGRRVYRQQCVTCHQTGGTGVAGVYPTLHATRWTQGDRGRLIRLVLHGMEGPVKIKGTSYDQRMQPRSYLSDEQVAAVLTYVRQDFGNDAPPVSAEEVAAVRAATSGRQKVWRPEVLWKTTGIPAAPDSSSGSSRVDSAAAAVSE